jgi:cobalt-precorrin-5B (C1)-methyltransferase
MTRDRENLRPGFTTGAAAAAAAKAALLALLHCCAPSAVDIRMLTGETWSIRVARVTLEGGASASALVVKDAGDDPDITHNAEIGARVALLPEGPGPRVEITGGVGVGQVTRPGLEVPPGEPAINPGPRQMITEAVAGVLAARGIGSRVRVEVFVPKGAELALKTLNPRLGILGGISILGTTGIVRPLSNAAWTATIEAGLSVARASGLSACVLTTGRRSEKHAERIFSDFPRHAFIQMGDFFAETLSLCAQTEFTEVRVAAFFGKAVKMAQGAPHTHAASSRLALEDLAGWILKAGAGADLARTVAGANTAREAFCILEKNFPEAFPLVALSAARAAEGFAEGKLRCRMVLLDFEGNVAYDTAREDVA